MKEINKTKEQIEKTLLIGIIDKNTHEVLISESKWIAIKQEITN